MGALSSWESGHTDPFPPQDLVVRVYLSIAATTHGSFGLGSASQNSFAARRNVLVTDFFPLTCHLSVALCGGRLRKGTIPLPGLWSFVRRELYPGTHPNARHFNFSLSATSALPVAALVLEPRGSESTKVLSPLKPFKKRLPRVSQFLLPLQPPLVL